MGQVIPKDAAVEDIINDAKKALTNAMARGGRWKELAELRLNGSCALFNDFDTQYQSAKQTHAPNAAAVNVANERADKKIGKWYDAIWNEVGRPKSDAALAALFPEGSRTYTEGDTSEQPDRMRVLVTLLGAGLHSKISAETTNACAVELLAEANALELVVNAARQSGAKTKVLSRVRTVLAKAVQAELVNLKRAYKLEGFSEAEIHAVIPDRPGKTKKADVIGATDPAGPPSTTAP